MLGVLIDSIFVYVWWRCVSTNHQYSNEYELRSATRRFVSNTLMRQCFLQWLPKNKENKLVQTFNSNIRYIDDILSLNNYRFADYRHRIYPNEHGVKDTTDTQRSASYLAIENRGRLKKNSTTNVMTSLLSVVIFQHHQRMEFTFHNSYVILERCAQYSDFMERA